MFRHLLLAAGVALSLAAVAGAAQAGEPTTRTSPDGNVIQQDIGGNLRGPLFRYFDFDMGTVCYSAYSGEFHCLPLAQLPPAGQDTFAKLCKQHSREPALCPKAAE